jgi:hypothetical protein
MTAKWTKGESILVLNLYFQEPVGVKKENAEAVIDLAKTLGRTPKAIYRHMHDFLKWYPSIPLLFCNYEEKEEESDLFLPMWNEYFMDRKKLRIDADRFLSEIRTYTLALQLYFQLIPDTMVPNVPEVVALAKLVKQPSTEIVAILHNYQLCDPFMYGKTSVAPGLQNSTCKQLWQRYNQNHAALEKSAQHITAYYESKKRSRSKQA